MHRLVWATQALAFSLFSGSVCAQPDCVGDLEALASYMLANDAGAKDLAPIRGDTFDAALKTARPQAHQAGTDDACLQVLRAYLRVFRKAHWSLRPVTLAAGSPVSQPPAPSFHVLSERTAMLVFPSFADQAGGAIAAMLKEHATQIAQRQNLLIDVRGNGGGSDWTYEPVLELADANLRRNVGVQLLATPANAVANRAMCDLYAPQSRACRESTEREAAAMDRAVPGSFIPQPGEPPFEIVAPKQVLEKPSRIGVLVDRRCGSTCEEFLLAMRQSFKVKLFGQSSAGSLDYSNLRPWTLPSGKWRLMYATSRSLRLPEFAVDIAGIPPDQVLPAPADSAALDREVLEVQRVLESAR